MQEFNTLLLTRFRTYKIAIPRQTKTTVKTTFRDWWLYSSFVYAFRVPVACSVPPREPGSRSKISPIIDFLPFLSITTKAPIFHLKGHWILDPITHLKKPSLEYLGDLLPFAGP
jgi:hypothetical protein